MFAFGSAVSKKRQECRNSAFFLSDKFERKYGSGEVLEL